MPENDASSSVTSRRSRSSARSTLWHASFMLRTPAANTRNLQATPSMHVHEWTGLVPADSTSTFEYAGRNRSPDEAPNVRHVRYSTRLYIRYCAGVEEL